MSAQTIHDLLSQFDPWSAWATVHAAKHELEQMGEAAKQDSERAGEIQVQMRKAQHEVSHMVDVWKWNTSAQIYALQFVANVLSGADPSGSSIGLLFLVHDAAILSSLSHGVDNRSRGWKLH
jgi:hypothetical protein